MAKVKSYCTASVSKVLGNLKQAVLTGQDCLLELPTGEVIQVLSGANEYYTRMQPEPPECAKLSILKDKSSVEGLSGRPIPELLWRMGHYAFDDASCDPSICGCRREDVFKLTKFPNLTRLPRTPNSTRIAMFLASRATCPALAARYLHVEEDEVLRFYCAASAAGYAKVVSRVVSDASVAETQPRRANGLLGRILDHLKGKAVSLG